MSTVGYGFAEAYVLRGLHKKKLKMEQEEERAKLGRAESEIRQPSGCLFRVMKKVHPSNAQSQMACSAETEETGEVGALNQKVR
ncbi:hypothetical protein L3X38_008338 [Prunus dulcis]|uniref:Uncharacterized protein n=1 Tax=Prunus dulcis TaxID=3755 RepID=A0AAD5F711_PRUDU|nr:hypothetical protein L3X38_008338 [Prunus dulcis]